MTISRDTGAFGRFGKNNNHIINGGFRIAQRGTDFTPTASVRYELDRWEIYASGGLTASTRMDADAGSIAVMPQAKYYMRVINSEASDNWRIRQPIEDVWTLSGKTVTLSCWVKGTVGLTLRTLITQHFGSGGTADIDIDVDFVDTVLSGGWEKITLTVDMPTVYDKTLDGNDDAIVIDFLMTDTDTGTLNLGEVQFIEGPEDTPYVYRLVEEELSLCQRYYEKSYAPATNPGADTQLGLSTFDFGAISGSTTRCVMTHSTFAVRKRATPTIVFYSEDGLADNVSLYNGKTTRVVVSTVTGGSDRIVCWYIITADAVTECQVAHWIADAEL